MPDQPCAQCGVINADTDKICPQCGALMPLERDRLLRPAARPANQPALYHLSRSYALAPYAGAMLGFFIGRFAFVVPMNGKPGALLNPQWYFAIAYTVFGFLGGLVLWLLNTGYFNDKHSQLHPNRSWRIIPAFLLMLVPLVGLPVAFWAKRGNRLPGISKQLADVALMVSLTLTFVVILIVTMLNLMPPKKPLAQADRVDRALKVSGALTSCGTE